MQIENRPIMRKMCDLINDFKINTTFTVEDFVSTYCTEAQKGDKLPADATVRVFLSRVVHQGFIISEQIPCSGRKGPSVRYTKILQIPEAKMIMVMKHSKQKLPDLRKKRSVKVPNSMDVFETLEEQHQQILELRESLQKANEDCKSIAERESGYLERIAKYQEELNFLKKKVGVDKIKDLSKYQKVL